MWSERVKMASKHVDTTHVSVSSCRGSTMALNALGSALAMFSQPGALASINAPGLRDAMILKKKPRYAAGYSGPCTAVIIHVKHSQGGVTKHPLRPDKIM